MKPNVKKVIMGMLLLVVFLVATFLVATKVILSERRLKQSEQRFSECFNQIPENPDSEDAIGLSSANLSVNEEKEIQEIIRKAFEGEGLYRYYYKNENEMDKLIENLYLPEEYQRFKKEIEEEYKYVSRENNLENISYSLEEMTFSKPRKYKYLDDRIGIIGESKFDNAHYFLFKKIDNQWKIEKEILPAIKPCFTRENLIIQQLLEQKNNETPESEVTAYLEAIKQNDKAKTLEVWQLLKGEKNINSNHSSFLEKRRDNTTEELIEKEITNFKIINIEWRSINGYDIQEGGYVLKDYKFHLANGARVQVQITDSIDNKSNYIFDIFTEGVYPEKIERDYSSLRNWILRDVYLENEDPLFWTAEKK